MTMHTVAHRAAAARKAAEEAEAERWVGQLAVEGAGSAAETAAQLEVRGSPVLYGGRQKGALRVHCLADSGARLGGAQVGSCRWGVLRVICAVLPGDSCSLDLEAALPPLLLNACLPFRSCWKPCCSTSRSAKQSFCRV